jgi:hypothetical protein
MAEKMQNQQKVEAPQVPDIDELVQGLAKNGDIFPLIKLRRDLGPLIEQVRRQKIDELVEIFGEGDRKNVRNIIMRCSTSDQAVTKLNNIIAYQNDPQEIMGKCATLLGQIYATENDLIV